MNPADAVHVAVAGGNILGESATWHPNEDALYWVDIRAPALHRLEPRSGAHQRWLMPDLCGGVVPAVQGVVVALRTDLAHFNPLTGALERFLEVERSTGANRLNEMKCDARGRLWIGSMTDFGAATTGSLYVIEESAAPRRVLTDITVPNSLAWNPDNTALYFTDTPTGTIIRYEFDVETGEVGMGKTTIGRRELGRPDGCTVDVDGYIWSTRYGSGRLIRFAPDGHEDMVVELPVSQPTSCTFGGAARSTLYITTARQNLTAAELERQPLAGHLFAMDLPIAGLPDYVFTGRVRKESSG